MAGALAELAGRLDALAGAVDDRPEVAGRLREAAGLLLAEDRRLHAEANRVQRIVHAHTLAILNVEAALAEGKVEIQAAAAPPGSTD